MKLKIAILYICTGKYDIFWQEFYQSCEKNFLLNCQKEYFVFTDANHIYAENTASIHKIYQKNLGWPGNTLFRYHIFLKQKDTLKKYDYIFFFNANMKFLQVIDENILPESGLMVVQHPGYYKTEADNLPYDRNAKSLAYIPYGTGKVYVCGGFNGGKTKDFLTLIETIAENTEKDYEKGIVARWHDESHINKYILYQKYVLLSPAYAYPENENLPFDCKILIRDKSRYGGHSFLRGQKESILKKVIRIIKSKVKYLLRCFS